MFDFDEVLRVCDRFDCTFSEAEDYLRYLVVKSKGVSNDEISSADEK